MHPNDRDVNLETLKDIRSIMERSSRFVSLSGMSGVWAGCTALVGAYIAKGMLNNTADRYIGNGEPTTAYFDQFTMRLLLVAIGVFVVAVSGALYFTFKKAKRNEHTLWNSASQQLLIQGSLPLLAGGLFCIAFIYNGCTQFVAPACLIFYGLALISGSRYTLSDIRYLGMLDLVLGSVNLFLPGHGLYFWAAGFGVLHIVYGTLMWNKYDK